MMRKIMKGVLIAATVITLHAEALQANERFSRKDRTWNDGRELDRFTADHHRHQTL